MAKIRLRFGNSFVNKNRKDGRARYYFRRPGLKAVSLPGIPGSEEFMAAYGAALASTSNAPVGSGASRTTPGTIAALVANYFKSAAWLRIPTIATGDSDGSRPPVPIDRDQGRRGCCDAVGSSL
jgi:hypothetical protein